MISYIVKLLRDHPSAPARWEEAPEDGLTPGMAEELGSFEARLVACEKDPGLAARTVREAIRRPVEDVAKLPIVRREALAEAPAALVPPQADLGPLVALRAAAAGGRTLVVPHHPFAVAAYGPLVRAALRRRGIAAEFGPDLLGVARIEISDGGAPDGGCTACALRALDGAGFVRLDLGSSAWREPLDAVRFIAAFAPAVIAGRPAAIEALAARAEAAAAPRVRTRAVLWAGTEPAPPARERIERALGGAPVVEWYSTPETGPVAYGCRAGRGLHVLPPDLHVESLPGGEELAFTGGRNPFLPLQRYVTGDRGRLDPRPCPCGDPAPRIVGLRRTPAGLC